MKLVLISDTHGQHNLLTTPPADVLIHAGDVSKRGSREEIVAFLDWFRSQPAMHKIFISGNHDFFLEEVEEESLKDIIGNDVIYLNDSGVTLHGLYFWGSPVQPRFFDWAFNRDRGEDINRHWQLIPPHTDVLITHGPPKGVLDRTISGESVGCEMLLRRIEEIRPKLSVFGHIHEGYGQTKRYNTTFVNASIMDDRFRITNNPVVVEIGDG